MKRSRAWLVAMQCKSGSVRRMFHPHPIIIISQSPGRPSLVECWIQFFLHGDLKPGYNGVQETMGYVRVQTNVMYYRVRTGARWVELELGSTKFLNQVPNVIFNVIIPVVNLEGRMIDTWAESMGKREVGIGRAAGLRSTWSRPFRPMYQYLVLSSIFHSWISINRKQGHWMAFVWVCGSEM